MVMRVVCPTCGREYKLRDEAVGLTFLCRSCGYRIEVGGQKHSDLDDVEIPIATVAGETDEQPNDGFASISLQESDESTARFSSDNLLVPVKVFGILSCVFGGLGLLGALWSLVASSAATHQDLRLLLDVPEWYLTYLTISSLLSLIAYSVLLASGVGLLQRRGWGRLSAVAVASFILPFILINSLLSWSYVIQPLISLIEQQEDSALASMKGGLIGGVIGSLIYAVFPVMTIFYMCKPEIKKYFSDSPRNYTADETA